MTITPPMHRLARARENAGLNVSQAANLVGWANTNLIDLEEGRLVLKPDHVLWNRFADIYGVNEPWLRGEVPLRAASLRGVVCALKRGKKGRAGITEQDRETLLELLASSRFAKRGPTQ